jgi:hypothetical protein
VYPTKLVLGQRQIDLKTFISLGQQFIWESVNKENTEAAGASEIEALISPATIKGLPWNTAVETTEVEE